MKKILFLALAVLGLAACKNQNSGAVAGETTVQSRVTSLDGEIVYVRMDSLMTGYAFYKELSDSLQLRSTQVDNDLTSRGRSLENSMRNAQDRIQKGLVTNRQAQELEQQIMQQQENLIAYRDQVLNQLAEEEQVIMNRITNSILEFMTEFNADGRYKMIISTTPGGPILNADPALDITAEALVGLNAYYQKNKGDL